MPDDSALIVEKTASDLEESGHGIGTVERPTARRPTGSAQGGQDVFLVRTTGRWICFAVDDIAAGCVPDVPGGVAPFSLLVDQKQGGAILYVYGVADDGITNIDVIIDREIYKAELSENFFLYSTVLAERPRSIAIEVQRYHGQRERVDL